MKSLLLVLALFLAAPVSAQGLAPHFDRRAIIAALSGQAADGISTYRFLHNGSGCTEHNPMFGPLPTAKQVVINRAVTMGTVLGAQYLLTRIDSRLARGTSRALGYAAGVDGVAYALHNIHMCGL